MSNKKAVNVGLEMQGFYTLKTHTADGKVTQSVGPFENLILNSGLDLLANNAISACLRVGRVGGGNTPPAQGDDQLDAEIAFKSDGPFTSNINQAGRYAAFKRSTEFGQGQAAGNISEVAIGHSDGTLFSRSLVKNAEGVPITLTVQANEFLTLEYELRVNQPTQDFNFTVDGKTVVLRAANVNSSSRWSDLSFNLSSGNVFIYGFVSSDDLSPISGSLPFSSNNSVSSVVNNAYTPGSFSRAGTMVWGIAKGNILVSSCAFGMGPSFWQFSIDPPINKTNEDELTIDVSLTWARAGELPV